VISTRIPQQPEITTEEALSIADVYDHWEHFDPGSEASFLEAYWALTCRVGEKSDVEPRPPRFRENQYCLTIGFKFRRDVPDTKEVKAGMEKMFSMIERKVEHPLVMAALAHFFILHLQPFEKYSSILGRFWQFLILARTYPIFIGFSMESYLAKQRRSYQDLFSNTGSTGDPTAFIEFMLEIYAEMLGEISKRGNYCTTPSDRVEYFHKLGLPSFTRKDYMKVMKHISAPTASRDLKDGIIAGLFERTGTKNNSSYTCLKTSELINTSGLFESIRPVPWPPMPAKRER
jgi:hypothetical protein